METLVLTVHIAEGLHEELVAELAEIGFEAFAEDGGDLKAYGPVGVWRDVEAKLMGWLRARRVDEAINVDVLPAGNWNAKWEATIQPLDVGPFVIAPTWAELGPEHAGKRLLLIDPKMSFGTGYHESTRIALRLLEKAVADGDQVLDAGTGTGVLAIAALKLGASTALGFDIDPLAVANAAENASLNSVNDVFEVREGTVGAISELGFDVVAVNMIRSRLEPIISKLAEKMAPRGRLVLAGLLKSERDAMADALRSAGLEIADEATENEWWGCVSLKV